MFLLFYVVTYFLFLLYYDILTYFCFLEVNDETPKQQLKKHLMKNRSQGSVNSSTQSHQTSLSQNSATPVLTNSSSPNLQVPIIQSSYLSPPKLTSSSSSGPHVSSSKDNLSASRSVELRPAVIITSQGKSPVERL